MFDEVAEVVLEGVIAHESALWRDLSTMGGCERGGQEAGNVVDRKSIG